jgi:hypothetical protein
VRSAPKRSAANTMGPVTFAKESPFAQPARASSCHRHSDASAGHAPQLNESVRARRPASPYRRDRSFSGSLIVGRWSRHRERSEPSSPYFPSEPTPERTTLKEILFPSTRRPGNLALRSETRLGMKVGTTHREIRDPDDMDRWLAFAPRTWTQRLSAAISSSTVRTIAPPTLNSPSSSSTLPTPARDRS